MTEHPAIRATQLGSAAMKAGRSSEAEQHFAEAKRQFESAGLSDRAIMAETMRGVCLFQAGRLPEAHRILADCDQKLPPIEECNAQQRALRAHLQPMLGATNLLQGKPAEAEEALERAEQMGSDVDGLDVLRSYIRMQQPGKMSLAQQELQAKERLREIAGDDRAEARTMMLLSVYARRVGDFDEAVGWLEQADERFARLGDPSARFGALGDLVIARLATDDVEGAERALAELERLSVPPGMKKDLIDQATSTLRSAYHRYTTGEGGEAEPGERDRFVQMATMGLDEILRSSMSLSEHAGIGPELEALAAAREAARIRGDETAEAKVAAGMAEVRLTRAFADLRLDLKQQAVLALEDCLGAIRIHDRVRHQLTDLEDRSRFTADILQAYQHGLLIACHVSKDVELVAELLLRIKAVGLPDRLGMASTGQLAVSEPPHVAVGGRSRLAADGAPTTALKDRIESQAGPGAWWWSMWMGDSFLFWAVRDPEGTIDAGAIGLDPDKMVGQFDENLAAGAICRRFFGTGQLGEKLARLRADLPAGDPRGAIGSAEVNGLLGPDAKEAAELFLEIGQLILPSRLRMALRAATREAPLRLLVDSDLSLSWLPFGLLGIEFGDRRGPITVLERAVVTFVAPLELGRSSRPPAPHGTAAVLDPQNEHGAMRRLADRASHVMGGTQLHGQLGSPSLAVATAGRILAVLADGSRYRRFLYAGHAGGDDSDPLKAGLHLGISGSAHTLSVGDLIEHAPMLQSPEVVILCACATGRDASTRFERWGLTTGFLLAGARAVIATGWEVQSGPFTADFVDELLTELESMDAGDALRQVQLQRLDRWRQQLADGVVHVGDPSVSFPYLWASYMATGATDAKGQSRL